LILLFTLPRFAAAQDTGLPREKTILPGRDTLTLDTLSLVPGSLQITRGGKTLDTSAYRVDWAAAQVILPDSLQGDSLRIRYRTYPLLFTAKRQHKEIDRLRADPEGIRNPFLYDPNKKPGNEFFQFEGLNKSGSISRGISFGNNQDLVVNSNLNLQLSGKLTDNIELLMAATDDNIPIQPEGNTQQLQDFDKVFIQLSDKSTKLIAGDFQIFRPNSHFMNFNKRAQGLHVEHLRPLGSNAVFDRKLKVEASAAVSRGKFSRNIIQGVEGNQGPYRLRGAENELFIVVLGGTEKVFIDGVLLKRGQEYDYVIDYNTAELIFTARQLITKDKRIVIEFQYSDRNYARSLMHAGAEFGSTPQPAAENRRKQSARVHFYTEQDSRNQPLQQQLSTEDKLLMRAVGDTLEKAVVPGADSVGFNDDEVLYKKIDTLVNTTFHTGVFVYSTSPDSAFYRVMFSNVGQGNGNYIQVTSAANGKVFRWIAPVNGVRQGMYEPVVQLITTKQKQLMTFAYDLSESHKLKGYELGVEGAFSKNDLNTFSSVDAQDDDGYGLRLRFKRNKSWAADTLPYNAYFAADYELVSTHFSPIERYRPVEFERDWNLGWGAGALRRPRAEQHLIGAGVGFGRKSFGTVGYKFNTFLEGSAYQGYRHGVEGNVARKGLTAAFSGSMLASGGDLGNTEFLRHKARISQRLGKITLTLREEREQSRVYRLNSDSLQAVSFDWFEWGAEVGSSDTVRNRFSVFYKQRTDWLPYATNLSRAAFAENAGVTVELLKNKTHQFRSTAAVRRLDINNPLLTPQQPDQSLVGRVEYNLRAWKNAVTSTTFYEAGSGLEQKKEYTYLEVAPGTGAFTWTDYNGNGVKELNEFETAQFTDQATYVRVFVPTNDYVKVYSNQFSQSVQLRPSAVWSTKKGFRKAVSYLSNQTVYRIDRKTTRDRNGSALNPFERETSDTTLVALNASFRTTLYVNQMGSKFGLDYSRQDVSGKSLLTNGLESRSNVFDELRLRWNITRVLSLQTLYRKGKKTSSSEFFSSRDYRIDYYETEPRLSIQPGTDFRVSFSYRYSEKNNVQEDGGQFAVQNKTGMEIKYNILAKASLLAEANYIRIRFNAAQNTSAAYEMLEGLKAGDNVTWKLSWQRTLANNMQLNIGYEGRSSPGVKVIHTGSAQVRAYF